MSFLHRGAVSDNAPADSEPASTFSFPGSATDTTEIELPGSACKKAGWVEGRACGRSRNPQCYVLSRFARLSISIPLLPGKCYFERALMMTGSFPFQPPHALGFVTSSHMKCATLAMLVLSGAKRLLTRSSCSVYSEPWPSLSVSRANRHPLCGLIRRCRCC